MGYRSSVGYKEVFVVERSAAFSPCRRYRYSLWRKWGGLGLTPNERTYAMFVGLNPSTADEIHDDPTIRRCIAFAKEWGFGGLCMANLFAFRSTNPHHMLAQEEPVGPANDLALLDLAREAGVVVAAWGVHGAHRGRDQTVRFLLPQLHVLRLTKDGHPGHPLYLPKTLTPVRWKKSP